MDTSIVTQMLTEAVCSQPGSAIAAATRHDVGAAAVISFLALFLLFKAGFIAGVVWIDVTWPRFSARTLALYEGRPVRCTILGVVNAVLGGLVAALFIASEWLALLGLALAILLVALVVAGFAAGYRRIARRAFPESSDTTGTLVLGGLIAEGLFLVPILGQAANLGMLFRGLGAATLAFLSGKRAERNRPREAPEDE